MALFNQGFGNPMFSFANGKDSGFGAQNSKSSNTTDNNMMNSSSTQAAAERRLSTVVDTNRIVNNCIPVTVKGLLSVEKGNDGVNQIFGKAITPGTKFHLVCQFLSKDRTNVSGYNVKMTDSTATMMATIVLPSDAAELANSEVYEVMENQIKIGDYCHILGIVRLDDKKQVKFQGHSVKKVKDPNQIIFHMIKSVSVSKEILNAKRDKMNAVRASMTGNAKPTNTYTTSTTGQGDVDMTDATKNNNSSNSSASVGTVKPSMSLDDLFQQELSKDESGMEKNTFVKIAVSMGFDQNVVSTTWDEKVENVELFPTMGEKYSLC